MIEDKQENSNTTNVKVKQQNNQQFQSRRKRIQIQPMLRLNAVKVAMMNTSHNSNTTNVKVKPMRERTNNNGRYNSNTTNVKVKPTYLKALCQYYTLKSLILQVFSLFLPGGNLLLLVADTICDNSFIYKGFLSFDKISAW